MNKKEPEARSKEPGRLDGSRLPAAARARLNAGYGEASPKPLRGEGGGEASPKPLRGEGGRRPASTDRSERLQKILSAAGVASRRLSESLIQQGRVSVNGTVVTELGTKADPARDDVRVDGRLVRVESRRRYILLNKPRGYVTTRSDPQGRRTVMDLLTGVREYVYPVGRLDYDSEGLLLLTNDGELAVRLMHPSHDVERVYEARVRGVPDARALERLARGIMLDGRRTAPARVEHPQPRTTANGGAQATVEIALHEGRKHQVRRMFEAVGHRVVRLRRIRIGPIEDESLTTGHYRDLTARELTTLRRAAGVDDRG